MDGSSPDPFTSEIVGAIAPVLVRLREEVDARVADLELEFGARMAEATQRMRELIEETRRRAEDAITASTEAVRTLAGQVAAEAQVMPDRMRDMIEPTRSYAESAIRISAQTVKDLLTETTAETRARAE